MKNFLIHSILIGAIIINSYSSKAQSLEPGQITFSAGYGFPSLARTAFNFVDGVSNVETHLYGPMYGKFEYAITDKIGFGVNMAYTYGIGSYETSNDELDSIIYNTDVTYKAYSILGRLNFHFGNGGMVDPYAGIGLGYRNNNYAYKSDDPAVDGNDINGLIHFGVDLTLGTRIYFSDNFGIYGEIGLAKSPFQIGVVAKF